MRTKKTFILSRAFWVAAMLAAAAFGLWDNHRWPF